jgi:hypothetical protein
MVSSPTFGFIPSDRDPRIMQLAQFSKRIREGIERRKLSMLGQAMVSRRSAVRALGFAGLGIAARTRLGTAATKPKAFALCGDESHNSDYIRTALTSTLVEEAGLSIDYTDEEKRYRCENAVRF